MYDKRLFESSFFVKSELGVFFFPSLPFFLKKNKTSFAFLQRERERERKRGRERGSRKKRKKEKEKRKASLDFACQN